MSYNQIKQGRKVEMNEINRSITVRLPLPLYNMLDAIAEDNEKKISKCVREAIQLYVRKELTK